MKGIRSRIKTERAIRLLHGGIGLATEGGEVLDALKKHIFYGKPLDAVNLAEEVGDLFWYIAIICDELGADFEDIMEKNIAKLKARYGEKFSSHRATNRDLKAERDILDRIGLNEKRSGKKATVQPNQKRLRNSNVLHRRKGRSAPQRQAKRS